MKQDTQDYFDKNRILSLFNIDGTLTNNKKMKELMNIDRQNRNTNYDWKHLKNNNAIVKDNPNWPLPTKLSL